ncbi:MAG: class I SAM-dependent methyltransferase [Bryobacteraceae bacterium]
MNHATNHATSLPDPAPILDLIEAFRRSKAMFAAVSMGIFDALHESPANAADLATRLSANADALERLLEACVGLKLLKRSGHGFANEPAAEAYLCGFSPQSMNGYVRYSNDVLFKAWANLEDAVREGSPRWQQTFGLSGPLFERFFDTEDSMRTFIMGMHGFGLLSSPTVARAFDLSRFRHLVDLGGATGHLTIAACEAYPELRGTVFDLERVVIVAREQVERSSARERIDCVAGDFFQGALPEADLYALGRILHDWGPAAIDLLLRKIWGRLPAGGALLIAEKLLDDDKCGPVAAQMQSLNMLVVTEGKERTSSEYRALLENAGFSKIEDKRTGKPVDAILATK